MSDDAHMKQVGDEARLLYSTAVAEIAEFKHQQWRVTNYALLLDAAIASMPKLLGGGLSCVEYVFLGGGAAATLVAGWIITGLFADSILLRRNRLTHLRLNRFTEEFRNSWRYGKTPDEIPDDPQEKINLLPVFRAVLAIGFVAAVWFLLRTYWVSCPGG